MLIVFLVGGYYPNFSANGNCISKIANRISPQNRVVIIAQKKRIDQSRYDTYNNQSIIRLTTNRIDKRLLIDLKLKSTTGFKHLLWKFRLRFHQVISLVELILNKYGLDKQLIKEYYEELKQLSDIPDVIIPVCFAVESIYATLKYCKNYNSVIFPILFDQYSENGMLFRCSLNRRIHKKAAIRLEEEMFKTSQKVFYVDNWDEYILKMNKYKEKVVRIEHPLIEEVLSQPKTLRRKKTINIVYQGVCTTQMRPPDMTLKFFKMLQLYEDDFKLHFFSYGNSVNVIEKFFEENPEIMEFYGQVDKSIADEYFVDSDISLMIGNKDPLVVPSKVFECISLGKPILYFYHSVEDKPIKILRNYPLVHMIKQGDYSSTTLENTALWIRGNINNRFSFTEIKELYKVATPDYVYKLIGNSFVNN